MKTLLNKCNALSLVAILILLAGCAQPETIVIDDAPQTAVQSDTTAADTPSAETISDFRKLVIGEYQPFTSFDPLLADNPTTMRALQLVYEGLVRLNPDGEPVPAVAKKWDIGADSLSYTFTLNRDTYYQDSDVFSTGTGRRVVANDIKFVFERMAQAGHPPKAAQLFMNIEGFEPYFQEQRNIYISSHRTLSEVRGIEVPNDSTVVFTLEEKDSRFLHKLATPYALIYPREAVQSNQSEFPAVGTGPFTFSSQNGDSTYIFAKWNNYRNAEDIHLNRVDLLTGRTESQLIRQIGKGDIHLLPQLGPNMMQDLITDDGTIDSSYENSFSIHKRNRPSNYVLYYNGQSDQPVVDIRNLSAVAYQNAETYFNQLPSSITTTQMLDRDMPADTSLTENQLNVVYSDDPFIRTYLGTLSRVLDRQQVALQMVETRVPTRNTELIFTEQQPLLDDYLSIPNALFRFQVHQTAMFRDEVENLQLNTYSWWLNLTDVTKPSGD